MNGRDYIESLKDGREVWYDGERVPSVPDHPVLKRCVESRAREYDLHSDPKCRELLSFADDGGESHCIMYRIPRSREDLLAYRRALETALIEAGGGVSDHMHFSLEGGVGLLFRTLSLARGSLASSIPPAYARNLENYYQHMKKNHLTTTVAFSEVKGDQSKPPWEQPQYMRVIEETHGGIVVKGLRKISAAVAYSAEAWTASVPDVYRKPGLSDADAAGKYRHLFFLFAVPVSTQGVKVICRPSEVSYGDSRFDHPVSRYDEIDGMIVYDNVLVPWERVFSYGDRKFLQAYGGESGFGQYAHLISMISRMEILVAAAYSIAEHNGLWGDSGIKQVLAELVVNLEAARACLRVAEMEPDQIEAGMALPSRRMMHVALLHGINVYNRMQQVVRDLGGGSTTTSQSYKDLISPEIGSYVEACFEGTRSGRERLAVLKLIEDLTSSLYAQRKDQFLRFSLGPPEMKKLSLAQAYDFKPLLEKLSRVLSPEKE